MAALPRSADVDRALWGWERFFEELTLFLHSAERQFGIANEAYAQYVLERLQTSVMNVQLLREHLIHPPTQWQPSEQESEVLAYYSAQMAELLDCLRGIALRWQSYYVQLEADSFSTAYQAAVVYTSHPGRPRFDVTQDQLEYLSCLSFSWAQISTMLGVSRMTVYRRRQEFGLLSLPTATLTDAELLMTVHEMRSEILQAGERIVWGRLRAMGFNITRARVRHAVRSSDPLNTALRWRGILTTRHPYSVPGPNSLWHIGEHMYNNFNVYV